jgi:cation diffusion facilitator CzcD-associated flavoprotein CzcO
MSVDRVPVCLDVLIVGAGLSGTGAACYLQKEHPAKSWAILEARAVPHRGVPWTAAAMPSAALGAGVRSPPAIQPWRPRGLKHLFSRSPP